MTVNELRLLYQQQAFKEAEILQDAILPGWIVEFRGQDGRLYEMTDTLAALHRGVRSPCHQHRSPHQQNLRFSPDRAKPSIL